VLSNFTNSCAFHAIVSPTNLHHLLFKFNKDVRTSKGYGVILAKCVHTLWCQMEANRREVLRNVKVLLGNLVTMGGWVKVNYNLASWIMP